MSLLELVIAYLVISIGLGLFASAKVHNARDYITAGRHLPMFVVLAMVFATWFGAETVLGNPGKFLKDGTGQLLSDPLGAGMCLMLFGLFLARPLYRMNLLTLGDFFRRRYGRSVELVLSICIVISYLGWVAAQIRALGLVFDLLSNGKISQGLGMIIGAAVVLFYTLLGGMWSVAVTTFVQMIVIVAGLLYVAWDANTMAGGFDVVMKHASASGKFDFVGASIRDLFAWGAAFFTMTLGSIPQQDVFQRVNSSGSERVAVWGTTLGGFLYILFGLVPIYLAYTAYIIHPDMVATQMGVSGDTQKILPLLVIDKMSFTTQVIFFGALLSVIMSTASGTLLAPSVTFSENVLRDFTKMTDRQFLWASRLTVVIFTLLVTLYALGSSASIRDMVEDAYRVTLAGAFVPLVAGVFWKRANNLGGVLSVGMGLTFWFLAEWLVRTGKISDIIEPQIYGLIASALGMLLGGLIGDSPPAKMNLDAAQMSDEQQSDEASEQPA